MQIQISLFKPVWMFLSQPQFRVTKQLVKADHFEKLDQTIGNFLLKTFYYLSLLSRLVEIGPVVCYSKVKKKRYLFSFIQWQKSRYWDTLVCGPYIVHLHTRIVTVSL